MLDSKLASNRMTNSKLSAEDKLKVSRVEVYWHTVKYRTVFLYVIVITAIVLSSVYLIFPDVSSAVLRRLSDTLEPRAGAGVATSLRQARFMNLDGKVQVKKVNSVEWVNADYQITLDTGDLIQTGSDGVGRIEFADGTQYTVKGDTFVTVEENIVAQDQPTQVSMQIKSGQVDLATGTLVPGSKADVSFANAVASLRANSRAAVSSDPKTTEQQFTVESGGAELNRGNEHTDVEPQQRATFTATSPITKSDVLAPPELAEPVNFTPIISTDPKNDAIHFSWKPVAAAKLYEFQASTTAMFNRVVADRKTSDTSADVSGFAPGDYFWRVRAIDDKNNLSEPGDPYKFTLVTQGKGQEMLLEVDSPELQGNVVEVSGRTEPGAVLIVNGEAVADIQRDGRFRYFTQPMTRGSHEIVITGQNHRGGTNIKRVEVVIP